MLNENECRAAGDLLDKASDLFAKNSSDTDFKLPDTPDNRKLWNAMWDWNGDGDAHPIKVVRGNIIFPNWRLARYLADLIEE